MAHFIGYPDECDATMLEMKAMENSGIKPFANAYAARCGL
jgi:hypothetical protein